MVRRATYYRRVGTSGDDDGDGLTLAKALPALLLVGSLLGVIVATLTLVGAAQSDIPSLTRGAPWRTIVGASFMVAAVVVVGMGPLFSRKRTRDRITGGAYLLAFIGLVLYIWAAVAVTSDPPAPQIEVAQDAQSGAITVTTTARGLAFNERLHVRARFADTTGMMYARRLLGPDADGHAEATFTVAPQPRRRRLQVTADVLDRHAIPRDFQCAEQASGRTCAEAAAVVSAAPAR